LTRQTSSGVAGRKILILIGSHLATAPRAQKEARALRVAGADVAIRGTWWSDTLADEDISLARELDVDFGTVADVRHGSAGRAGTRIRQRIAREMFTRFGVVTPRAFGLGAPQYLAEARRIAAGLTIVHCEAGLWAGKKLILEGHRVAADFEDWFSHDMPQSERIGRPVDALHETERHILRHASYVTTTTRALADALAVDAGIERIPFVIPNSFPALERSNALSGSRDSRPADAVSFYWFSQTIGPGRGLETLARAIPLLRGDWSVTLRGSIGGHSSWFEETFADVPRSRFSHLETVPNSQLLARTMSHDVGLALEEPYCASRDLTATNKLFEYFRGGLAVIATRTRGQEEVMSASADAGVLIGPGDPADLAQAMQAMIDDRELLKSLQRHAVLAAETTWAWERHADALVTAAAGAFD
jgi:glycosyltransferase involved in cell wall biosynthesis